MININKELIILFNFKKKKLNDDLNKDQKLIDLKKDLINYDKKLLLRIKWFLWVSNFLFYLRVNWIIFLKIKNLSLLKLY